MCNINIIYNIKNKKSAKITECMNVVSYNSFKNNKDAEGYYCEDYNVRTSVEKQIFKGKHSFIVAHERFSTSGKIPEMAQPLESENFIFTHNGVFSSLGDAEHSDSWYYLQSLEEEYAKTKDTKEAVNILNKKTGGYYSVVLYNKVTKEHLYYKHSASMYMLSQDDYVLMSTKQENVEYMRKFFDLSNDILEVKEDMFFDLNNGMTAISPCEHLVYTAPIPLSTYSYSRYKQHKNGFSPMAQRSELLDSLSELGIYNATVGVYKDEFLVGVTDEEDMKTIEYSYGEAVLEIRKARNKWLISLDIKESLNQTGMLEAYLNAY